MWSQFLKLSPGKKLVYATGGSLGVGIATMSITELLAGNSQQVELERRQLQARIPRLAAQQRAAEADARPTPTTRRNLAQFLGHRLPSDRQPNPNSWARTASYFL